MREWKAAISALVMSCICLGGAATPASALCQVCDMFLHCMDQMPGARVCLESPGVCSMLIPCVVSPGRVPDGPEAGLLTLSLFDAVGTPAIGLETDAGPLAVGNEARGSSPHTRGRLAAAMLAHGLDYALWFADAAGGGFAVRRSEAGAAVQVEVLEMSSGTPGRVLASGLLLPQDRLRAVVQVDGRERVLIVQAVAVGRGQLTAHQARLRQALNKAARELPPSEWPLLQPRPL
jgi:hypothetical protein